MLFGETKSTVPDTVVQKVIEKVPEEVIRSKPNTKVVEQRPAIRERSRSRDREEVQKVEEAAVDPALLRQ